MRFTSFLVAAVLATFSLNAQEATAGIYGTVQDSTSSVIPNAAIVLHNVDTGRDYQTVSDPSGAFANRLCRVARRSLDADSGPESASAQCGHRQ
jgi:hypothetical protein